MRMSTNVVYFCCCVCGMPLNSVGRVDHCGKCSKAYWYAKKQIETLQKRVQDQETEKWIKKLKQSIYRYTSDGKAILYESSEVHLTK